LGYFREDYQYNPTSTATPDYLDEHNGRFCVTPEYPNGIYCYFTTVDANWNSAYPYVVGPTFYGVKTAAKVTSITEPVTVYTPAATALERSLNDELKINFFPSPAAEFVAVQVSGLSKQNITLALYDLTGKFIQQTTINQGSTIAYFDVRTLYNGQYLIKVTSAQKETSQLISIVR
jgi:hypothetical protein